MVSMAPMEMCDHDVVEDMYKAVYILEETASRSSGRPFLIVKSVGTWKQGKVMRLMDIGSAFDIGDFQDRGCLGGV